MDRRAGWIALAALGVSACVPGVPIENSSCPCGPASGGYSCCGSGSAARCVKLAPGHTCGGLDMSDAGTPDGSAGPRSDAGLGVPLVTSPFVSIGIGKSHACGVRQDGTMTCFGSNTWGQAWPPPPFSTKFSPTTVGYYMQVAAGGDVTCAKLRDLNGDGYWLCTGDPNYGQPFPPSGLLPFSELVVGERHACAAAPHAPVVCWGDNTYGQAAPPPLKLTNLTAGHNHTCGIDNESLRIVCWGDNSKGQTAVPPDILLDQRTVWSLSAGGDHTCVGGGLFRCWGDIVIDVNTTTPPFGADDFTLPFAYAVRTVASAAGHICGLAVAGQYLPATSPVCWGYDWGDSLRVPATGSFSAIYAGDFRTCVAPVDSSAPVLCWGPSYEAWY
jgi:hypothetical protein